MVYTCSFLHDEMDVDVYMAINEKLWKPRDKLIKALFNKKYGHKYWSANEMMSVIHENNLSLYKDGKDRPEKQIKDAMSIAYENLQTQ